MHESLFQRQDCHHGHRVLHEHEEMEETGNTEGCCMDRNGDGDVAERMFGLAAKAFSGQLLVQRHRSGNGNQRRRGGRIYRPAEQSERS